MGRYTQRRRAASVPVDSRARIATVTHLGGVNIRLNFNRQITATAGATVDLNFNVDGQTPTTVAIAGPTSVNLTLPGATAPGDPWALTGQPSWLATIAIVPESGIVV
jgi:hypothetical protein